MLRAVALRFESGAITSTSTPSISRRARRAACSPGAVIPSSFVSKTRIALDSRWRGGLGLQKFHSRHILRAMRELTSVKFFAMTFAQIGPATTFFETMATAVGAGVVLG